MIHEVHIDNAIIFLSANKSKLLRISVEGYIALDLFLLDRYFAPPQQSFTHAICIYTL